MLCNPAYGDARFERRKGDYNVGQSHIRRAPLQRRGTWCARSTRAAIDPRCSPLDTHIGIFAREAARATVLIPMSHRSHNTCQSSDVVDGRRDAHHDFDKNEFLLKF